MNKKMLMVTTIQDTVEAFLVPHIKMLEEKGYEVWIGTNIYKNLPKDLENNKWINISFSRNPFSLNSFKAIGEIRKLIRENDFEMVHFHTPVAAFLGRYGAMLEKQKNIIYTAHGFHFYKGASLVNWLVYYPMELLAARWTDKIITINEEDYQNSLKFKLRKNGKYYKVNGVGLDINKYQNGSKEKIKKELNIKPYEYVILIIGELNKNKNQIQLLEAISLLKDNNIRVLLVGVGKEEINLKKISLEKNIKVDFLGYRNDIRDIIAVSNLLCSMSYREGLPRNIMEGMAQGKPFIVTNIRGNRDIIKNYRNGILVEIENYKSTAEKILEFQRDFNLNIKVKENNLIDIQKFSIEKILKYMEKIYE